MDLPGLHHQALWRDRAAFALATAVFFLLCHGLLGASHTVGFEALPSDADSHVVHQSEAGSPHHGSETPSHDGHGFAYAAVLVTGLFLLALALTAMRRATRVFSANRFGRGRETLRAVTSSPCRGPTLPALQVFRL